ncbi:MAG: DUF871 family protein, partial [Erysipelotrichaceae bacterium]|nr:DUF871 family protein [Erysipelotrichaceae bacterium]
FVSSQNENTIGVWDAREGLCTVERMRDLPLEQQIRMMIAAGDIDTLIIGNACANEEEFREVREAVKEHVPDLNNPVIQMIMSMGVSTDREYVQKKIRVRPAEDITNAERDILFGFFPHTDVGDSSEWIWRSRIPRFLKKRIPARPYQGKEFPVGSVLMVNDNYSHYAGEVQIAMLPIINDGIRNLIGTISGTEMEILKLVRDMEIVIFLPEK